MAKDLLENFFDSIDLIVTNKLGDLNYDKTEQCTVEEVKGDKEYYVSNGAAKYIAYAQNDTVYKEGDSVYVTIPQGNYNNQKLIIGKHTAKKSAATDWVSPMEDFVNITGSIVPTHKKRGLIANNPDTTTYKDEQTGLEYNGQIWQVWKDSRTEPYTQYDRLCITADFSTLFKDLVIEGSYGVILRGTIEDTRLEKELADLKKEIDDINKKKKKGEYSESVANKKIEIINKKIEKTKEKYKFVDEEKSFACILDAKDMLGNPYDFGVPFRQEKMFEVEPTSKISKLEIYFYQGLTVNQEWKPTFYDVNNELIAVEQNSNLFVENITVNFGYSYESYKDETAILYTLDPMSFSKEETNGGKRELRLRWVHYDDNQKPHSIRDLSDNSLKYHFAKVHWYRYKIDKEKTDPDPLAGYFWEEIKENEDKFTFNTKLNLNWREEKFKVIIQFDGKIIKSEELVFNNPEGTINYGQVITGLTIKFPDNDPYKGTFYIYGDDYVSSISSEKTFDLIAEFETIDANEGKVWDENDVICWKFPADYTMIHKPEYGFEFDFDSGFEDKFLDANSQEEKTVEVSGFIFKTDREYHQIIRKIKAIEISDGVNDDAIASRTQSYRVKGMFDGSNNNIIKCEVYKPEVEMVHDEISFTFGLHTTNGTKYTMAINWVETALDGETYERPSALTVGETENWKFDVKILNSAHEIVEPKDPKKGWDIELQWFENRIYDYDGGIEDFIKLNSKERTLTVKPPEDFKDTYHGNLQYQILEIKLAPNVFDYELTTYLPIPVRLSRNFIAMDGADRIYYDSTGYNPRFSDKAYNLIWRNVNKNKQEANKKDQERDLVVWGIKSTDDYTENPAPESQKPGLENKDNNYYLKAPGVYLPAAGADRFYGTCVYAKSAKKDENGNIVVGTTSQDLLWVQPLYITMDAYGSKFFNDWDGKMVIDEENNYLMTSMIGAGVKDEKNRYSGVVLGTLDKIKEEKQETGILGFDKGVEVFSFLNDGSATLGKSGAGQIQFNGSSGYIMSGNFDGFGAVGTKPQFENGKETLWKGNKNWENPTQGAYIGLSTGRAWFAGDVGVSGTIYANEGTIGGWKISENYIDSKASDFGWSTGKERFYLASAKDGDKSAWICATNSEGTNVFSVDKAGSIHALQGDIAGWKINASSFSSKNGNKYTVLKNGGSVGLAFGALEELWESSSPSTTAANAQFWHNGRVRLGYFGKKVDGKWQDADSYYKVVIDGGNATFKGTVYAEDGEFTGKVTAEDGTIGGWKIGTSQLSANSGKTILKKDGTINGATIKGSQLQLGSSQSDYAKIVFGTGAEIYANGNDIYMAGIAFGGLKLLGGDLLTPGIIRGGSYQKYSGENVLTLTGATYYAYVTVLGNKIPVIFTTSKNGLSGENSFNTNYWK